ADQLEDPLPDRVRAARKLVSLPQAIAAAHFPESEGEQAAARRRLVFDDFFLLEIGLAIRRQREGRRRGLAMNPSGSLVRRLRASLPYSLTAAQERVWSEIRSDMDEA